MGRASISVLQVLARGRGPEAKAARKALLSSATSSKGGGGRRKKRGDPEGVEQREYLRRIAIKHPTLYAHTFSVPNERASQGEAGRMKALGVKTGVPDLMCALPSGPWHGLAIEMKAPGREGERDGGRSPAQVEWGDRLVAAGWFYRVEYSAEGAEAAADEYLAAGP